MNDVAEALRAAEFAAKAHHQQWRKYTGEPYIVHPLAVAQALAALDFGIDVVQAAILHDVVEDTPVTLADIRSSFGADVADLVNEVTKVSKPEDGNRAARIAKDAQHYAHASPGGQSIKLADLIDNTRTILLHDRGFAKIYFLEKRDLLKVLTLGDPRLYSQAKRMVDEFFANERTNQ